MRERGWATIETDSKERRELENLGMEFMDWLVAPNRQGVWAKPAAAVFVARSNAIPAEKRRLLIKCLVKFPDKKLADIFESARRLGGQKAIDESIKQVVADWSVEILNALVV